MTTFEDDAFQAAGHALSGARHFPHGQASSGRLGMYAPVDARSPAMQHAGALRQARGVHTLSLQPSLPQPSCPDDEPVGSAWRYVACGFGTLTVRFIE